MNSHRHTWGARGRPPRKGDLCLCCPCEWSTRGRGDQYRADDYKPRTQPHTIHPRPQEQAEAR
jgi:hypothetical protein